MIGYGNKFPAVLAKLYFNKLGDGKQLKKHPFPLPATERARIPDGLFREIGIDGDRLDGIHVGLHFFDFAAGDFIGIGAEEEVKGRFFHVGDGQDDFHAPGRIAALFVVHAF